MAVCQTVDALYDLKNILQIVFCCLQSSIQYFNVENIQCWGYDKSAAIKISRCRFILFSEIHFCFWYVICFVQFDQVFLY